VGQCCGSGTGIEVVLAFVVGQSVRRGGCIPGSARMFLVLDSIGGVVSMPGLCMSLVSSRGSQLCRNFCSH